MSKDKPGLLLSGLKRTRKNNWKKRYNMRAKKEPMSTDPRWVAMSKAFLYAQRTGKPYKSPLPKNPGEKKKSKHNSKSLKDSEIKRLRGDTDK